MGKAQSVKLAYFLLPPRRWSDREHREQVFGDIMNTFGREKGKADGAMPLAERVSA